MYVHLIFGRVRVTIDDVGKTISIKLAFFKRKPS